MRAQYNSQTASQPHPLASSEDGVPVPAFPRRHVLVELVGGRGGTPVDGQGGGGLLSWRAVVGAAVGAGDAAGEAGAGSRSRKQEPPESESSMAAGGNLSSELWNPSSLGARP